MRVGRFILAMSLDDVWFEAAARMLGSLVAITRCEHMALPDHFEYVGICDQFDDIAIGRIIPSYDCRLSYTEDKTTLARTYKVKFRRQP